MSYQLRMDFDHVADNAELLSPRDQDGLAQEEEEKTPDFAVRKAEIDSGLSSVAGSKGDSDMAKMKMDHAEHLLDLDPHGRQSPEPEQTAPVTDDRGSGATRQQHETENQAEHVTSSQESYVAKPENEKDQDKFVASDSVLSQVSSDTPYASNPLSENPVSISSKPGDPTILPGSAGETITSPVPDSAHDSAPESSERKSSPSSEKLLDIDAMGPENDLVASSVDSYLDEPTPKNDTSFEIPISSTAAPTESLIPTTTGSAVPHQNLTNSVQDLDSASAVEKDVSTPEQTPTFPKSDSPILLETATEPGESSANNPTANPDTFTPEPATPYINPDPFQDYIPPTEKKELGDHQPGRIPSPSSMDAEPPTPVEHSALGSLKEDEEVQPVVDAEGVVDELPLEALRNRAVQEALASVIPPAPDKPLPPTPSAESRTTARCLLGHLPGGCDAPLSPVISRFTAPPRLVFVWPASSQAVSQLAVCLSIHRPFTW